MGKLIKKDGLQQIFAPLIDLMVEEKLKNDRAMGKFQLLPIEQQRVRDYQEIEKALNESVITKINEMNEGLELLLNTLSPREFEEMHDECEAVLAALFYSLQEIEGEKEPLPPNFGFSEQTMRLFYQKGYELFQQGKWEEALKIFSFLTFLNPLISDYWLVQGMAEQRCQYFDQALCSYSMATSLNSEDPLPRYYTIYAYLEKRDQREAERAFDEFVLFVNERRLASWSARFSDLKQKLRC